MASGGFITYLKKAFFYHWNLLAFGAAVAVSFISGKPDVILPAALAAEVGYLAILSTNGRYQNYVDAMEYERDREGRDDAAMSEAAARLYSGLTAQDRRRFENLRDLCSKLMRIAGGAGEGGDRNGKLESMRTGNIDRMLWVYLKLLYSKAALDKFFAATDEAAISAQKDEAGRKVESLGSENDDTPERAKHRAALADIVKTSELRLDNYKKARDNYEYVQVELERMYTKIAGIAEMGIARQDPRATASEIEVVSSSALETERAMHELDAITGIGADSGEKAPVFIGSGRRMARE